MQFADDPAGYFGHDGLAAHRLDPIERERLQQEALGYRLEQLLPRLAPLSLMAQMQGLDAGIPLARAPALFYPHTIYKSYDPQWLQSHDFGRMTAWANCLITKELALPAGMDLPTIDAWLAWLESDYGLDITHSTGTTGRMSLVFRDGAETDRRFERIEIVRADWHRSHGFETDESQLRIIFPGPRSGRSTLQRVVSRWLESLADPAQLACLHETDLGADYELYVVGARDARARGQLGLPPPGAYVEAMLAEADRRFAEHDRSMVQFVERVGTAMQGRRVMVLGGPLSIHAVASAGLACGIEGKFSAQSFSCRLGGLKGLQVPADMEDTIARFICTQNVMHAYGMTELNAGFFACEAGRYHIPPWIVAWVLDPQGHWAPKPREHLQEGRAAFLDLATQANWGGLVTADHVRIDYSPCGCGRTSPSLLPDIRRVEDGVLAHDFVPAKRGAVDAVFELMASRIA